MKRTIAAIALLSCVLSAWGLSVPIGERRTLSLGFEPETFMVSAEGRDCIQVTLPPAGSGSDRVSIEGRRIGRCTVTFYENGAERAQEEVTVTSGLAELRRSLSRRLAELAGVTVEEERGKLVVSGVVSNPADWEKMEKILAMEAYRGKVENLVSFQVDRPTIEGLKRKIQGMGFRLTESYPHDIGTLQMLYEDNILKLTGTVYSQADAARIRRLLEMQSWLKMEGAAGNKVPGALYRDNISVDQQLVELTAVIMAVSESASREIGSSAPSIEPFYRVFYDFLRSNHASGQGTTDMRISATVGGTLTALAGNGILRQYEKSSMRFHLNRDGERDSRIKWGGTMKLQMQNKDGDGNITQSYENVEYGFTLEKIAARRISADTVELQLKVEQRTTPKMGPNGSWTMGENVYTPVIECKLGETVIIGGYERMMENSDLPNGMPLLRHIPIVNWFVSKEGHQNEDVTALMAISVEPVKAGSVAAPVAPPKDITLDISKTNDERIKEKQRHRGCWTPLNWFTW